jgi:hypothetical protein
MTDLAIGLSPIQERDFEPIGELSVADFDYNMEQGAQKAKRLKALIDQGNLAVKIGNGKHVRVEGWITVAEAYGLKPDIQWVRRVPEGGFECRSRLINPRLLERLLLQGVTLEAAKEASAVSHAEMECGTAGDDQWVGRPAFQQRSMVQTRAISKVISMTHRWVLVLAGYSGTPAEEMVQGRETTAVIAPPKPPPDQTAAKAAAKPTAAITTTTVEGEDLDNLMLCPIHEQLWYQNANMKSPGHATTLADGGRGPFCDRQRVLEQMSTELGQVMRSVPQEQGWTTAEAEAYLDHWRTLTLTEKAAEVRKFKAGPAQDAHPDDDAVDFQDSLEI